MADIIRIKRRAVGGAAGAPSVLAAAEIAYNEQDDTLYYGKGNSGGNATSIIPIAGQGAFLRLSGGNITGSLNVAGNVGVAGSYIYLSGSGNTGSANTTGGPLIYADANTIVLKAGSGNTGVSVQNYAGTVTHYFYNYGRLQVNNQEHGVVDCAVLNLISPTDNDCWIRYNSARTWATGIKTVGSDNGFLIADLTAGSIRLKIATNGDFFVYGYLVADDLKSNANCYIPNGYGYFGGDITTVNSFYSQSVGDAGASTTTGFLNGRYLRFRQNAGDDGPSGSISYRVYDGGALCIVGTGTNSTNRRVKIWDILDVSNRINTPYIWSSGDAQFDGSTYFGGGGIFRLFNDGNAHIESTLTLWFNSGSQAQTIYKGKVLIDPNGQDQWLLEVRATTGSARILSNYWGIRAWSIGTLSNGNFMIADESAYAARLEFNTDGAASFYNGLSINGFLNTYLWGGREFYLMSPQGNACRMAFDKQYDRLWRIGIWEDSSFRIADWSASADRFRIDTNGFMYVYNHLVPNTNAAFWCGVDDWGLSWWVVSCYNAHNPSDRKLKRDIQPLPDCLGIIDKLSPKRYFMINAPEEDKWRRHWGFVAQEVGEVMDEAGYDFDSGYYRSINPHNGEEVHSLNYNDLVACLWKAVQELSAKVTQLEARIQ